VDIDSTLADFYASGLITSVVAPLKSGKEATVYLCEAGPTTGATHYAAKVYRPRENRGFKNDALYHEGRWWMRMGGRAVRAVHNRSEFGREAQFSLWAGHEWTTLTALWEAGVPVPRPIDATDGAILMEFIGEAGEAAPPLRMAGLTTAEAARVRQVLLGAIERMLRINVIHGDLSPYNVLYHRGEVRIIDFPQAIDPRFHTSALMVLARDVENVCRGDPAAGAIARDLWGRFERGEL
jgi:RIO kinase 1